MIPITVLKKDFLYNKDLKEVLDILKLISSSEFSRISSCMPKEDVLEKHIINCFCLIKTSAEKNIFFVERKDLPHLFLLVCSDKGFLGEVNSRVVGTVLNEAAGKNSKFMVLGERGAKLLEDSGITAETFPEVKDDMVVEEEINEISDYMLKLYKQGKIGAFSVVYMQFVSFTMHHIKIVKMLPCNELANTSKAASASLDVLIEPSAYHAIEYLVRLWVYNNLFNMFWSSKLSEWAIRVMNLDHSAEELKGITEGLRFKYFKTMHGLNDKVIREIFAAKAIAQ